jgi:putative membrane protein
MSDPRVFFAAERTLLAWIRTGLTVMGFGFVVARFGLFLRMLAAQHETPSTTQVAAQSPLHVAPFSSIVGISLVAVGAAALFFAAVQHRQYIASIPRSDIPDGYRTALPLALAYLLGALGLALVVYLAVK